MPEERQQLEMSIGADSIGAPADLCQMHHSSRIVGGPPLGSLMCDSGGNRVTGGVLASPPVARRMPSASSLTGARATDVQQLPGRMPSRSSLPGCRIRPPQIQAQQDWVQDPLSERQQPETFLLTPRVGGGMQQWALQSPQWEECSSPGTVSPVKGAEATRPNWQTALGGAASPRQGPVPQLSSPQRIPAAALAKWEGKNSPKASARGTSVAGFTQQHTAETGVLGRSASGRPPPKTLTPTEKDRARVRSASPEASLDQQVPIVFGRQNWPPRPPGCSSPGHSPVKSPQKIPASALAPWQGQGSSPKLLPFIQELTG